MFVQDHHTLEELQQLTKALTQKRLWLRHQAVVLAKQGHSAPEIALALGAVAAPFRPGSPNTTRGASRPSRSGPTPDARPAWRGRMCSVPRAPRGRAEARGRRLHPPVPGLAPHPGGGIRRDPAPSGDL